MKKLIALVLALAMVLMVGAAFAATSDTAGVTDFNVTATINSVKEGNTVNFYRLATFNLDAATNDFSYTLATGMPAAYDTVEELAAITSDGYVFTAGSPAKAAADNLANGIANGTIAPLATLSQAAGTGDVASKSLPAGWYVVTVSGTADTSVIYQNMIINALPVVNSTTNAYVAASSVAFTVKSSPVTITKGVGATPDHTAGVQTTDAYSVGDTVPYEIKTNIPNYPTPSKEASFVITDTPTNLTDAIDSVKVTVTGDSETGSTAGSITGKFTVAAAGNGFTVTFVKDYLLAHPGAAVTVNYNAVISASATIANDGLTAQNTAKITFNPNPNETSTVEPDDTTKDYTYGLTVLKYDETDTATVKTRTLTGAKFILYAADGTTVVRAETEVNANGRLTWDGLEAGEYKLVETKAPAGFKLDSNPRTITLSSTTATGDDPLKDGTQTYVLLSEVPNAPGTTLPSTGGIGTTIFYILGGLLVVGAAVILVARRKASN